MYESVAKLKCGEVTGNHMHSPKTEVWPIGAVKEICFTVVTNMPQKMLQVPQKVWIMSQNAEHAPQRL